jgi:hypothetical protein
MKRFASGTILFLALFLVPAAQPADPPAPRNPREALQPFNELIGSWRGLGTPEGSRDVRQKGLWQETISWEWQFKGNDAWLTASFDKGKHFTSGELRWLPGRNQFQLTLQTTDKQTQIFTGPLQQHRLLLERHDPKTGETSRLVVSLLHDNRYLYHYEVKPASKLLYSRVYLVGATKEGVPFVASTGEVGPLCVVSYGPPTSPITYKGQTYYVCCSGCREAFREDPEKFIREYNEYLAKLRKEHEDRYKKK